MSIFDIDAKHHTFPHKLKCELCHDRISIMCIDHNAARSGHTGFKCQACWARMKTNIQNSLSQTIWMQYTNDCRLRSVDNEHSFYVHDSRSMLFGCSANGTKTPDKLEAQNLDYVQMSSVAGNISDQDRHEADAFERQVGYCTTPDSIDHQHGPHQAIAGERLPRCSHCLCFLLKEPTCKHDESDGSSTDCPESDEAPSRASSAAVKHKLTSRERHQKFLMELIKDCEDSATASAPEDPDFVEHNNRMTELKNDLRTTLDKGRRCEEVPDFNTMD